MNQTGYQAMYRHTWFIIMIHNKKPVGLHDNIQPAFIMINLYFDFLSYFLALSLYFMLIRFTSVNNNLMSVSKNNLLTPGSSSFQHFLNTSIKTQSLKQPEGNKYLFPLCVLLACIYFQNLKRHLTYNFNLF